MTRRSVPGARYLHKALRFIIAVMMSVGAARPVSAETAPGGEYAMKATFLYNFARFSKWPVGAFHEPDGIRLCILEPDPFGAVMATVSGRPVGTRRLQIVRMRTGEDVRTCQIVFIGGRDLAAAIKVVRALETQPVLTIAEIPDFARSGGAIEFNVVEDRVRFAINPAAAQRHGVTLSSQLLRLADVVEDRR